VRDEAVSQVRVVAGGDEPHLPLPYFSQWALLYFQSALLHEDLGDG
jgi:hypothetical protein